MEKELKAYTSMNTQEKAQAIYMYMLKDQREALENLLIDLSLDTTDPIMMMEDWVEEYQEYGPMFELIQIAQESKELDINDDYIRISTYYYGYVTSNSVINLVDEDEAIDWIANALNDSYKAIDSLDEIDKVMQIKFS